MQSKRYQVFISSTFTDLQEERQKVIHAVMEMDCMPAGMELFPAMDQEQLDFIKSVIDDSDYYVIIVGARYGSLNSEGISYTEAEYDYAVSQGLKVIALIHGDPNSLPMIKVESGEEGRAKLDLFRAKIMSGRLVRHWRTPEELPGLLALSLQKTIKTYPAIGWIRGNSAASTEILAQINELRQENDRLNKQLTTLKAAAQKVPANISSGEDKISIKVAYKIKYRGSIGAYDKSVSLSWNKIIDLLGMKLLKAVTAKYAHQLLEKALCESNGWSSCDIKDYDVETIGIQLSSLGLLRIRVAEATTGSVQVWWQWTSQGIDYMTLNRLIPKKQAIISTATNGVDGTEVDRDDLGSNSVSTGKDGA